MLVGIGGCFVLFKRGLMCKLHYANLLVCMHLHPIPFGIPNMLCINIYPQMMSISSFMILHSSCYLLAEVFLCWENDLVFIILNNISHLRKICVERTLSNWPALVTQSGLLQNASTPLDFLFVCLSIYSFQIIKIYFKIKCNIVFII